VPRYYAISISNVEASPRKIIPSKFIQSFLNPDFPSAQSMPKGVPIKVL
jgi:hypothetical protein